MKWGLVFIAGFLLAALECASQTRAPQGTNDFVVVQQQVAAYSLNPPHEQRGYFPQGARLQIVEMLAGGMVRVRFASSSGRVLEGLCRATDLQSSKPTTAANPVQPAGGKPPGAEYNERDWLEDSDGHRQATEYQGKFDIPMLIFFYTDWNESCDFLWKKLLDTSDFKNQTKKLIKVRINPEHGKEDGAIAAKYGLRKYPSTFMIDRPHADPRKIDLLFWSFGKMKTLSLEKTLLEIAGGGTTTPNVQPADTGTNTPTEAPRFFRRGW